MAGCERVSWFCFLLVAICGTCVTAATDKTQLTVLVGQTLIMECQLQNPNNGPVFWKKGGDILSTNGVVYGPFDSHMLLEERNGVFDLTVDSITLQDEDTYECEIPTVGKAGFTITVNKAPMLTVEPEYQPVEVEANQDIKLACLAEGKPQPQVEWSRTDKKPMRNGDMTQLGEVLELTAVTEEDTADYLCEASNVAGTVDDIIQLLVRFAPQVTVAKPAVHTGPGDDVTVDCVVHASPEATVVWYHNDSVIDRQERTNLNIRTEGEKWILHITDLLPRDLGEYSCVAGNTYGSDSGSNVLTAHPEGLQITGNALSEFSDAYRLEWNVGSVAPMKEYELKYKQLTSPAVNASEDWDEWQTMTVPANPSESDVISDTYTLRDLGVNSTYALQIKARNEFGESDWTEEFLFSTNSEGKTAPSPTTKPPTPVTDKPQSSLSQESKAVVQVTPEPPRVTAPVTDIPGSASVIGAFSYGLAITVLVMFSQLPARW